MHAGQSPHRGSLLELGEADDALAGLVVLPLLGWGRGQAGAVGLSEGEALDLLQTEAVTLGSVVSTEPPHHPHPPLPGPPPPLRAGRPGRGRGRALLPPLDPPLPPGPLEAGGDLPTHLAQPPVHPLAVEAVRGQQVGGRPGHGHF